MLAIFSLRGLSIRVEGGNEKDKSDYEKNENEKDESIEVSGVKDILDYMNKNKLRVSSFILVKGENKSSVFSIDASEEEIASEVERLNAFN